jgi:hypothetical protein
MSSIAMVPYPQILETPKRMSIFGWARYSLITIAAIAIYLAKYLGKL